MTEIAEALEWFLRNTTDVVTIVGTGVYPDAVPREAALPFVVYRRVDLGSLDTFGNEGGSSCPDFELTCWATSRVAADTLARAVLDAVDSHRSGYWGVGTGRIWVGCSTVNDREEVYEEPPDGAERGTFGVRLTATIFHND